MGHQIDETHRSAALHRREGKRAATAVIGAQFRELGEDARDRIVQRHLAVFDQLHEGDRDDRLGHARNAEQRILAHRGLVVAQAPAMAVMHRLTCARDEDLGVLEPSGVEIAFFKEGIDKRQLPRVEPHIRRSA